MGILQKKRRTTGKKALAYRGKGDQNTGTAFLALRLGVVLHLSKKMMSAKGGVAIANHCERVTLLRLLDLQSCSTVAAKHFACINLFS